MSLTSKTHPADCGAKFEHDTHPYLTERKKIKICDGSITKRNKE